MKELSSYELCLLIFLCYKQNKRVFLGGLHPNAQSYRDVWTRLQNTVNAYCKDTAIKVIEPSKPTNTIIRKKPHLIIQVENKELLEKFLDNYSAYFEDDALDSYNYDRLNFNRLDKQFESLIGKFRISTDKNKILTKYYIDDTNYLPIILWGLRNECIGFKDIRFSLPPKEEELDRIPDIELRKRKLRNNGSDLSIIDFCITVDLSDFIRLRGLRKAENKAEKNLNTIDLKEIELDIPEWKIFSCIYMGVKDVKSEGYYLIDENALTGKGIKINSTFEKDRSRLNNHVRKIVGRSKETKRFLIKPNGNKYKIDMALYQEFYNIQEKKFINFLEAYKAKNGLP